MKSLRVMAVAMMVLSGTIAHAECVTVAVDVPSDLNRADLVFAGTVVKNDIDRVTFKSDRIWKGRPSRDVVIHLIGRPSVDSYGFQVGQRYVIFARLLRPEERIFIADNSDAFGIYRPCGKPVWPLSVIPELDRTTRGRKPR